MRARLMRAPLARLAPGLAVVALAAAAPLLGACTRVVAPPPPAGMPVVSELGMVGGPPLVVAARAARVLQDLGFTTKRFATDSLWGRRAQGDLAARLRYTSPYRDSTRVLVEMWGPCARNERHCLRADALMILTQLNAEEAPPQ